MESFKILSKVRLNLWNHEIISRLKKKLLYIWSRFEQFQLYSSSSLVLFAALLAQRCHCTSPHTVLHSRSNHPTQPKASAMTNSANLQAKRPCNVNANIQQRLLFAWPIYLPRSSPSSWLISPMSSDWNLHLDEYMRTRSVRAFAVSKVQSQFLFRWKSSSYVSLSTNDESWLIAQACPGSRDSSLDVLGRRCLHRKRKTRSSLEEEPGEDWRKQKNFRECRPRDRFHLVTQSNNERFGIVSKVSVAAC